MGPQGMKLSAAPTLWALLRATVRLEPGGAPVAGSGEPVIYACLHRDILPCLLFVEPARPCLLVSGSDDGAILVRALRGTGFGFVRGATGERGARALVELRRVLEAGRSVGIAVDGPKGPFGAIRDGVAHLAALTGCAVVPLVAAPGAALRLRTWDRTVVPLPGSRVRLHVGSPLVPAAGSPDQEAARLRGILAAFFAGQGGAS
ncbi:MAG: DUF374 domain-containing protein [bacterium]|nr:DUF374 domain-containing protein [bacterium]